MAQGKGYTVRTFETDNGYGFEVVSQGEQVDRGDGYYTREEAQVDARASARDAVRRQR